MRKSKFTESQIVGSLKEADAGIAIKDLVRRHGGSAWRRTTNGRVAMKGWILRSWRGCASLRSRTVDSSVCMPSRHWRSMA